MAIEAISEGGADCFFVDQVPLEKVRERVLVGFQVTNFTLTEYNDKTT